MSYTSHNCCNPELMVKVDLVTDATSEPVTLAEVKSYLRLEISNDDVLIQSMITAARKFCEGRCHRSFGVSTFKQTQTGWGCGSLTLYRGPLISVVSVQYYDLQGNLQTLPINQYLVAGGSPGGISMIPPAMFLPSVQAGRSDSVSITFTAGDSPIDVKMPICALVYDWYVNRGIRGADSGPVPMSVLSLLDNLWRPAYR